MGYFEILIIAGLILINGFFVTVEFALVKVRATQIEQLAEAGQLGGQADEQGARSSRFLSVGFADRDHGRQPGAGACRCTTGSSRWSSRRS